LKQEELRDYIRARLGSTAVNVELSDVQIDIAIQDTLSKFNQYLCAPYPRVVIEQTGTVKIVLEEGDRGILYVKTLLPDAYRAYGTMSVFELMYRMVFPTFPISDWYLLKGVYETFQRVRGSDPDWWFDESVKTLYVDCSSGPYDVFYVVAQDLNVENIDRIKKAVKKDFLDYCVALAKQTLANVRGKFGGTIPVPGGTLSTDADVLRTESLDIKEKIEARLENRARYTNSPIIWA